MPPKKNLAEAPAPEMSSVFRMGQTEFHLRVGPREGDLLRSGAEVLVLPADTGYVMRGRVAQDLKERASDQGREIATRLRDHKPLVPGDVAITSASHLRLNGGAAVKNLYHAVLTSWSQTAKEAQAPQVLQATLWRAVSRCMALAQLSNLRSIAFPSLGTGSGRAARFDSHSTMAAACLDALQPDSSLQRVLFCFRREATADVFRRAFLQQRLTRLARGLSVRTEVERDQLVADLQKLWKELRGLRGDIGKLTRLVVQLEETPTAEVLNQYIQVGDIVNSSNWSIGHGSQVTVINRDR